MTQPEQNQNVYLPNNVNKIEPQRTYVRDSTIPPELEPILLAAGESPLGPPTNYYDLRKSLEDHPDLKKLIERYNIPELSSFEKNIRERFKINEKPYIVASDGGSDEILERSIWFLKPDQNNTINMVGFPPHFPNYIDYARRLERFGITINFYPVPVHLSAQYDLAFYTEKQNKKTSKRRGKSTIYYLCNPSTPKGEVANPDDLKDFLFNTASRSDLLVADEAFGDIIPDNESAIQYTQELPNLMVLRSFSKTFGVPGERYGYAVMSRELGEQYNNIRRNYDIKGFSQLLLNTISDPRIVLPHLEDVREKTRIIKEWLVNSLKKEGITVYPTDPRTPICLIDGKLSVFNDKLREAGLDAAPVSAFADTMYTPQLLTDRFARITIPESTSQMEKIIAKINRAELASIEHYIPNPTLGQTTNLLGKLRRPIDYQ